MYSLLHKCNSLYRCGSITDTMYMSVTSTVSSPIFGGQNLRLRFLDYIKTDYFVDIFACKPIFKIQLEKLHT